MDKIYKDLLEKLGVKKKYTIEDANTAFENNDYANALRIYKLLVEKNDVEAIYNLGCIYNDGEVVEQDKAEAIRLWRLGAELGEPNSQYNLGYMYEHGEVVMQDYDEAVKWYRLAAASGKDNAQFNLGVIYDNAYGGYDNKNDAIYWYELAAKQGYVAAQYNLGHLYMERGALQNFIKAYMWWDIAAAKGDANALMHRDIISDKKFLTVKQITEARKLAKEFIDYYE